jgi:hypothetical protein
VWIAVAKNIAHHRALPPGWTTRVSGLRKRHGRDHRVNTQGVKKLKNML